MAETTADTQPREPAESPADEAAPADPPEGLNSSGVGAETNAENAENLASEADQVFADGTEAQSGPTGPVEISLEELTAGGSGDPLFAAAANVEGAPLEPVVLDDRYEIHPGTPLPEFDSPSAKAYRAEDRSDPGRPLFALMCIPGMPVRMREINILSGNDFDNLMPLVYHGHVDWPLAGRHVFTVLYQRPVGGRVVDALADMRNDERARMSLLRRVVIAIRDCVSDLMRSGMLHRGIRPGNLYFLDANQEHIVLGNAFTSPPGFDQPVVFETIERGIATPAGRGLGLSSDDTYATGVTLVFLAIGRNPVRHLQPREITLAKLTEGSFATLIGRASVPQQIRDLLRGVLHDDLEVRWGMEELDSWIAGRRLAPPQTKGKLRAERGIKIAGKEYFEPRTLAFGMAEDPEAAIPVIRDGTMERWVLRGLEDKDLASAVSAAVAVTDAHRGDPRGTDDVLVSRVIIYFDPSGPVRYKRLAFMPEGFGTALAVEILRNASGRVPSEILQREIVQMWIDAQVAPASVDSTGARLFNQLRGFLQLREPGFGLTRCLYEVNPGLPCLSPFLENEYVLDIDELLPALDRAAHETDTSHLPMDDHLAAFIAARFDGDLQRHLAAFGKASDVEMTVGVLGALAALQDKLGPPALYGLASWMGGLIGPAIRLYRSRARRREIEGEIPRLVREGSLMAILALLNDPVALNADEIDFDDAREEFEEADEEIARVEKNLLPNSEDNQRLGQQGAAVLSVVIALSVVAIFLIA